MYFVLFPIDTNTLLFLDPIMTKNFDICIK